jgi:hypothetical protein
MTQLGHKKGIYIKKQEDTCPTGDGEFFTNMTGDELCACLGGQLVRFPHSGYSRCGLRNSFDQTLERNIWNDIIWDTEIYNIGNLHNDIDKEKINISKDGFYRFIFQVKVEMRYRILYKVRLLKNGTEQLVCAENAGAKDGDWTCLSLATFEVELKKDDYLVLQISHDYSISTLKMNGSDSFLCVERKR